MSGFLLKAAVVSGIVGLVSVFAAGTPAQAAPSVSVSFGTYSASADVVQINHRHGRYNRPHYRSNRNACSPRRAAMKASRMGIRGTHIRNNRSTIRVSGYRHGRPASVLFAKARGCPVIR